MRHCLCIPHHNRIMQYHSEAAPSFPFHLPACSTFHLARNIFYLFPCNFIRICFGFLKKTLGVFSMGFWRESHSFCFWNLRKLFLVRLKSSISRNIGNFLRVGFFYFAYSQSYFLKYMKFSRVFVSWNIRKSHFLKYKEFFSGFPFPVI